MFYYKVCMNTFSLEATPIAVTFIKVTAVKRRFDARPDEELQEIDIFLYHFFISYMLQAHLRRLMIHYLL